MELGSFGIVVLGIGKLTKNRAMLWLQDKRSPPLKRGESHGPKLLEEAL
jgi:hypothetical protein